MSELDTIMLLYEEGKDADYITRKVFGLNEDYFENLKAVEYMIDSNKKSWVCLDCGRIHDTYPCDYEVFEGYRSNENNYGCLSCGSEELQLRRG